MGLDIKSAWKGLKDFVMPPTDETRRIEEEPPVIAVADAEGKKQSLKERLTGIFGTGSQSQEGEVRHVANGGTVTYPYDDGGDEEEGYDEEPAPAPKKPERPNLVLHQAPRLKVRVYEPSNFDQAAAIADDLRDQVAVVVNYERVEVAEQRRICDFINGCCYVTDGGVKRISDTIVLYVPEGVNVSEAMSVALEK